MSDDDFNNWDPKAEDFNDLRFNSYLTNENMSIQKKKNHVQLFVEGIPCQVTNEGLRNLFLVAGEVVDAKVMGPKKANARDTFGFVTMKTLSQAKQAIHLKQGFSIHGSHLRVKIAMTAEEKEAKRRRQREDEEFLNSLGQNQLDSSSNNNYQSIETHLENGYSESSQKLTSVKSQGMGRGVLHGQAKSPEWKRPLLNYPEPPAPQFGPGYGRGYSPYLDPVAPHFGAGFGRGMSSFWPGPHPFVGPQGPYGYGPLMPPFRPGLGRGFGPFPGEFYNYRPQTPRPYGRHGEERRSRDEGFNRSIITPSSRAIEKRKQKLLCIACKQPASKKCGRCKLPYCSSSCQKNHYPEHIETCKQLHLMATASCNDDELDSRFDITVDMQDVAKFQTSLDQLVTDTSDTDSILGKIPQQKKRNGSKRKNKNNSNSVQKNVTSPTSKASVDSKIKLEHKQAQEVSSMIEQFTQVDLHVFLEEDIGSTKLAINTRKKVWVSHVDSPSEVWIQVVSDQLQSLLTSIAKQKQNFETAGNFQGFPRIGDLCLAKAVGEKWYRSTVVALKPSNLVQIRYLDFGNLCTASISNLRPLPEDMLTPTAQAVRCCIAGIVPLTGTIWNDKAKNVTSSVVRTDTEYEMEAIEKHGDLYLVNLFETNTGVNVIQRLISAKIAVEVVSHTKIMARDMKSIVDELHVGQELNLYFIDCKSPGDFTAQIIEEVRLQKFQQMLKDIEEDMAVCKPTTPYRPEIGEMVFGYYTEGDNTAFWTRAEIIDITDKTATVRYIDYGNVEQLEFSHITQLNHKFASLPGQALECFLFVDQKPKQWSEENIAEFKKQIGFAAEMARRSCVVKVKSAGRVGLEVFNESSQSLSDMFSASKQTPPISVQPSPEPNISASVPDLPIMADVLQSVTLPVDGSLVSASVADVVAFDNFSIQLASESAVQIVKQLMLDLCAHVESAEDHPGPCLGELVCAKYTDDLWYRCKVRQVEDDHCLLLFLDFGNEDKVDKTLIKVIDKSFLATPIQSVKGKLAGAVKTSDTDIQSFATQVVNCENKFKVLSHDNSVYEVEIFLSDGQCLNDKFRAAASKKPLKPEITVLVQQPALTISPIRPVLHEFQPAAISFVTDPGNFCCNLLREFQELSNITSSMAQYCQETIPLDGFSPQEGDFCFGKFLNVFYRARIEKKLPDGKFELQYVDYGNVESVSLADIRPMIKEFVEIPSLAFKCSLHGLRPIGDSWTEEATSLLKEFMSKLLLLKVEEVVDGCCHVNLMQNNVNVGQMLVNKGLAVFKIAVNDVASSLATVQESVSIPSMATKLHIGQKFKGLILDYSPPSQLKVLIVDEKILEERNEFQAELDQAVKRMSAASLSPHVGDFILGLYSEDGHWYRAKVEAVSASQIKVFYVDFGNSEQIDVANARPLPTEWSRQPAFIMSCFVDGVHLPDNEVLSKEKEELCQHSLKTILVSAEMPLAQAEIKSLNGDSIGLDLYKDDCFLSAELVSVLSPKKPVVMAESMCSAELPIDGSLVDCEFIHVEDLGNFFVRKDDIECRTALDRLMFNLNSYCENHIESHTPVIGEIVAVQFSVDKTWNRGLVYEVTANSCTVNFIDFGNNEETTFSAIRPLDPEFSKLPIQAIACSLARIPEDKLLSEKEKFINLGAAKKVKVKVVPSENTLKYAVDIFLPDGSNVSDLLNETDVSKNITVESLTYYQPTEKDFHVAIQDVVTPAKFYCTELDIKAMEEQTALNEALMRYCCLESTPKCRNLKVGDLCCGLFDREWYRGEVKEVLSGNRVRLFYIDYGNTNEVDISETRVILKEHTQAKVMAIHCRLNDVHSVGADWDSQAIDFLSKRKEKLLNASVISMKNNVYTIQLINPENGSDVAKEMVMDGLALDDAMIKQQIDALHAKLGINR